MIVLVLFAMTGCGSGVTHQTPDCTGGTFWHGRCSEPGWWVKQAVQANMLREARAGDFQAPPKGYEYGQPVECRVDRPNAFHGGNVYLCKIAVLKMPYAFLWEWGAWYHDGLHTHRTDPKLIPTITGAWDPPW